MSPSKGRRVPPPRPRKPWLTRSTMTIAGGGHRANEPPVLRRVEAHHLPYRPRDKSSPRNTTDWLDRLLSRAASDNSTTWRHIALAAALTLCASILLLACAVAAHIAQVPPWVLRFIALGGTGLSSYLRHRQPRTTPTGGGEREALPNTPNGS